MAEVTKPIALDESFNTTESTPRNTADVLAEGLDAIATAIENGGGGGGDYANKNIAVTFDTETAYSENDYVIYSGNLYRAKNDVSAGTWTGSTDWESVTVGEQLNLKAFTVVCTQSQYDTWSGTTPKSFPLLNAYYVITDAPNLNPTASDIEYSSGVSVADMLGVVDVSSDITRNTTNVASTAYTINCYTVGKMAYLIITNFQTLTAWGGVIEIATGLPKPKTDFNFVGSLYNSNGGSNVRLRVRANGDLYSWYNDIASGSNVFGCIAYPIA